MTSSGAKTPVRLGPRDPAAKPESSFQRDPSALAGDDQVSQASLERTAKILEAIESFLDYIDASGVAESNGAIVAEGRTGYDCDICLAQKAIGKILRGQPELTDVEQHIKCALRLDRGHIWNFGESIDHVIASHIKFLAHIGDRLLISFQRGERAPLRERGWIRGGMTLN